MIDDTDVVVARATPADLDTIARMNRLLAEETEGRRLDEEALRAGVAAAVVDPQKGTYYVARRGEAAVGTALVTTEWSDWRNGWFWWLQSVYVERTHRRTGVFRALYRTIAHAARNRWDVCGLRLYVERENEAARATYAALGMVETSYVLLEQDWSGASPG
jgi:GNAT superfamily N-acetyltransferase